MGRRLLSAMLAVGFLSACSEARGPSPAADVRVRPALVEELDRSISDLGMVTGLALGTNGEIAVSEVQSSRVRVFSRNGEPLITIDALGAGPGDIMMPCCVALDSDRKLWIYDLANRRYSVFRIDDSSASFVRTIPSGDAGYFTTDRLQPAHAGGVFHISTVQIGPDLGRVTIASLDSSGEAVAADTLLPLPNGRPDMIQVSVKSGGGVANYSVAMPFGATEVFAVGPGGSYARALTSEYRIERLRIPSDSFRPIVRSVPAVAVSVREADSADAYMREWASTIRANPSDVRTERRSVKPPLHSIGFDQDGRIWVRRNVTDGDWSMADLYRPSGAFIETRTWPADIQLVSWASQGDTAIGVRISVGGEQSIVRLRFGPTE